MSFPPGTKIFQFSGFAFITYVFSYKYLINELDSNSHSEEWGL